MAIIKSAVVWIVAIIFMTILFPVTFVVWILTLPFDSERRVTHWMLVYQSILVARILPVWNICLTGREKIASGTTYVIISNHQSMLDIILLNMIRYRYKWISKIENRKVPFIGWYLHMAAYITVNRSDDESKAKMLAESLECLKRGTSIMIFPEGTRSRDLRIGFFKRGAFQLAVEAGVPILPVLIDGTGGILPKHGLVMGDGHRINIKIFDPVMPGDFVSSNPEELAAWFREFYTAKLEELRNR